MRLVGAHLIARAIERADPGVDEEALRAFVWEIEKRDWATADALAADFADIHFEPGCSSVFSFFQRGICVRCLIDFPTRTVLVESCDPVTPGSARLMTSEAARQ